MSKLMLDYDNTISAAIPLCLFLNRAWRLGGGETYCVSGNPQMPVLVKQQGFVFDDVHVIATNDAVQRASEKLLWLTQHDFGPDDLVLDDSASNCIDASHITNAATFISVGAGTSVTLGTRTKRWTGNRPQLSLGRNVRKWRPITEVRTISEIAMKHKSKLASALVAQSAPGVQAALEDCTNEGYADGSTSDTPDPSSSTKLQSLLENCAPYAVALVAWFVAQSSPTDPDAGQSADEVADRVTNDTTSDASTAATCDTAAATGKRIRQTPDDSACQQCIEAGGIKDPDDDDLAPVHQRCLCTNEVVE